MSPSLGQEGPLEEGLEEGLETHSSILAWRIPMDRGAQWAKVHGIAQSWTLLKQLSTDAGGTGVNKMKSLS